MFIVIDAFENMTALMIPKMATLAASSMPETAKTRVGMPLETP